MIKREILIDAIVEAGEGHTTAILKDEDKIFVKNFIHQYELHYIHEDIVQVMDPVSYESGELGDFLLEMEFCVERGISEDKEIKKYLSPEIDNLEKNFEIIKKAAANLDQEDDEYLLDLIDLAEEKTSEAFVADVRQADHILNSLLALS